jgi:alginate O-acetyltransferase complex protein AlgJ
VLFGINGPWFGGGAGPILRPPSPFPQRLTPESFRRVSAWFNDRLGMRYPLMVLDSHWRLNVWRLRFRGDVLLGHASWLFFNDSPPAPAAYLADFRGTLRMSESTVTAIDRQIASAGAGFAACGKAVFVVVAPNKQSIYPEELRKDATHQPSRLDDFLTRLSPEARAVFIDPRSELRASKPRYGVPVYHPTDSHWNDLGAFIAYQKIVSALAATGRIHQPELASLEGVEMHAEAARGGDVATRLLYLPWNFPDQNVVLRGVAQLPLSVRAERDRVVVSNRQGRGKLLILADSFGPPLASLLGRHFAEVEMLSRPTWPALFDGALVASANADVTIIEIAERSLPELVQAPARLDQMCR